MAISLAPRHLGRYRDLAKLLLKYGRSDIVRNAGLAETLRDDEVDETGEPAQATELADDLERLGPTYIKLGQLLSTRADLLPAPYLDALSRLQDNVEPFPYADVERIVTSELAARPSKLFASFDPTPLAAASLGQVHRATLRDGREVVVKVQRPDIRARIREDVAALSEIAGFLDNHTEIGNRFHFTDLIQQFERTLARELDYREEASNLRLFRANLAEFRRITVPAPIDDYTTSYVLTMERISGHNIAKLNPVVRIEIDGDALCDELFRAYLKQIFVDGVFHADPHPGNVFLTPDGRLALIDLGMTGHVAPQMQDRLLRLLVAIVEGAGEDAAETSLSIGETSPDLDRRAYVRDVAELVAIQRDRTLVQTDVGRIVMEITGLSGRHGVRQPPELALLGKALLNLHMIASMLAPNFNPFEAVRRRTAEILRRKVLRAASPGNVLANVLELNDFVQQLPTRVNRLLDRVTEDGFEVKINAVDETKLISGLEKIANRITLGLVLAALIVGAALLIRIESSFMILGYPGLPMIFFLAAALGGLILIHSILKHDQRSRRQR